MSIDPNEDEQGDDFPERGDAQGTIQYSIGSRLSGDPIGKRMTDGTLMGNLIGKSSQLYSSLIARGSNAYAAIKTAPMLLSSVAHLHSVDLEFRSDPINPKLIDQGDSHPILDSLNTLALADAENVATIAADMGGAVTQAYLRFTTLLGEREIKAEFFVPTAPTLKPVRISPQRALSHSEILGKQQMLETKIVHLTGLLDMLADSKGAFALIKTEEGLSESSRAEWRNAIGQGSKIEGSLSDSALEDIQRLNAWRQRITAVIQVVQMTSPKTTKRLDVDATLLEVSSVQHRIG
ncbi:MAG TPA: hypothetical protein VMF31_12160 [Solirubrobacterales bacterium]|nr:hypothetical protein [Solirubrobacterales bacterium]